MGKGWEGGGGGESPFEKVDMEGETDIETVGSGGGGGMDRDIGGDSMLLVGVKMGGGLLC